MDGIDELQLCQALVRIDSSNPGAYEAGMTAYIEKLAEKYLPAAVRIETAEVLPERSNIMLTLPGESEKELVLICHQDTVPLGPDWTRDPLGATVEEGRLYGRGSCDMKGGFAAALAAFLTVAAEYGSRDALPKRTLKLIGSCDEEADMHGAEKAVEMGWVDRNSLVLDTEPTDNSIQTAHKSRFWFSLCMHGKAAHASEPWEGADAIAAMGLAIAALRRKVNALEEDPFLGRTTLTFGQIRGGIHPYQVPAECEVSIDMRVLPQYSMADVQAMILAAAEEAATEIPGIRPELIVTGQRPAVPHYPDSVLLRRLQEAVRQVAGEPVVKPFPGYTDTAVIAGLTGNENTMSYGPGSLDQAHKPDEFVPIADLHRCRQVYELLMRNFLEE